MTNARNLANLLGTNTKIKDVDVDGTELILDADADTSITADTDDQIDIKIGGADDFAFKANKFEVQTGSNIDMNGTELILDADGDTSITADTDDQIDFKTGGSDRLVIDSSGNVMIGRTSSSSSTAGAQFSADGNNIVRDGQSALTVKRLTSNGDMITLAKDGDAVGAVGGLKTSGGGRPYLASDTHSIYVNGGSANVNPGTATGSDNDNAIDLGASSARWKNLYLSGGIYVGGTGSANYLDDYEEGTWTPAIVGTSNTPSFHNQVGRYTKIGRNVFIQCFLQTASSPTYSNTATQFKISGAPFSLLAIGYTGAPGVASSQALGYVSGDNDNNAGASTGGGTLTAGINASQQLIFHVTGSGQSRGNVENSGTTSGFILEAALTYLTDA